MNVKSVEAAALATQRSKWQKATQTASQFEEVFVRQMIEGFRKTQLSNDDGAGMFGSGPGSDTYGEWFDQHMSKHLSSTKSIGIADMLMRDMQRYGQLPTPKGQEVNRVA